MFLFISTASPVTSAVSVLIFLGTCFLSSPFSPKGWLAFMPHAHLAGALLVLFSSSVVVWTLLRQGAWAAGAAPPNPQPHQQPALDADALKLLISRLPLEAWLCCESRAALSVRDLRERLDGCARWRGR